MPTAFEPSGFQVFKTYFLLNLLESSMADDYLSCART